ncbi:RNA dependent RNA polymerase-domain-containing protein [Leucosporidium creatinivorum]|uniref:RNA-dependent RNA polymerase n=1 Tax=Leucosporidium creatinivorum TaxID=106004 RepID=A0A1Y2FN11_9BASI|nr:RNA dependent RNA polymerase-domain-containing protein [Leucosporidium creatinivorum]
MEVFIDHVPFAATELDLIESISAVVHHPPVRHSAPLANFRLHLFLLGSNRFARRKAARVTFADIDVAQRLLSFHGYPRPGPLVRQQRLRLRPSIQGVPSPELVNFLRTTPFVDPREERQRRDEFAKLNEPIKVSSVEFGRLELVNGSEVFSPELQRAFSDGSLSVDGEGRRIVLQSSPLGAGEQVITIAVHLHSVISARSLQGKTPSILLLLTTPPTYEAVGGILNRSTDAPMNGLVDLIEQAFADVSLDGTGSPPRRRLGAFDDEFARVAPFVGRHLRIIFPTKGSHDRFRYRKPNFVRLPRIIDSKATVRRRHLYDPGAIEKLNAFMAQSDIRVAFQVQRALSNGILSASQLSDDSLLAEIRGLEREQGPLVTERILHSFLLRQLATDRQHFSSDAGDLYDDQEEATRPPRPFTELAEEATRTQRIQPASSPQELLAQLRKTRDQVQPSRLSSRFASNQASVCRHVVLTPSGIKLEGPLPDQSNATLRRYGKAEYFLRVSIREEDLEKHRHDFRVDMKDFIRRRYLPFFVDGIPLCGRTFRFLGYSQSALHDHSTWFVAPFEFEGSRMSAPSILKAMGDFSKVIYIPARFMARIAQLWTTTQPSITLKREEIRQIKDVERFDPKTKRLNCITDGVGTISTELAAEVDAALLASLRGARAQRVRPSCWQIRLGGSKGMISVDRTLKGRQLCLRPSMQKFDASDSLTLDIAQAFDRPLPAFLNRPLIKILEDLGDGTSSQAIMAIQQQAVKDVEAARSSLVDAAGLLERTGLGTAARAPSTLRRLSQLLGLDYLGAWIEPFASFWIDLAVVDALRTIKFKARIPVDGWTLVGVADEDGILGEGEIFACIRRQGQPDLYLEGEITISRSPSIHPGDVQIVRAVGKLPRTSAPRTSSLFNCVVMSTKGARSLASCLGGGDYDGDLFLLITDSRLLPQRVEPPAAYEPAPVRRLDQPCTLAHGAEFFLDYVLTDLIGLVSSRHLHIADSSPMGTFDPDCLLLAGLHSAAVDFPKSGQSVSLNSLPKAPPLRPDFLVPAWRFHREREFYPSQKLLGRLFRDVPYNENLPAMDAEAGLDPSNIITTRLAWLPIARLPGGCLGETPERQLVKEMFELIFPFIDELVYFSYLNSLSDRPYDHLSEGEVFIGTISAPAKDDRKRRDSIVRLQEQTGELMELCRAEILGFETSLELQAQRAWAAWMAAKEADAKDFGVKSFGWLALGVLLEVLEELKGQARPN